MRLDRVRLVMGIWGAVNGMVNEFFFAMTDKKLTGSEFLKIIKTGLMNLRLAGIGSADLSMLQIVATEMEFKAYPFKDGDGALIAPKELLDKLKVSL